MEDINLIIGNNIKYLRKSHNLTQNDLAEKINYSNKAVSRWESGEVIPDVQTLNNICSIFNIPIAKIFEPNLNLEKFKKANNQAKKNKLIITSLAILLVWVVATILFVYSVIIFKDDFWQFFLWAIPTSCIIALIFNSIWGNKKRNFAIIAALIWSTLLSIYLTFIKYNLWLIFIIGVPIQVGLILWSKIESTKNVE